MYKIQIISNQISYKQKNFKNYLKRFDSLFKMQILKNAFQKKRKQQPSQLQKVTTIESQDLQQTVEDEKQQDEYSVITESIEQETIINSTHTSSQISTEYQSEIADVIKKNQRSKERYYFSPDHFCSGFITTVYVCERRLFAIPFQTCIISHSCVVVETTRNRAYLLEYCENQPVLVHDVTRIWSFKPTTTWQAFGYNWTRDKYGVKVPIVNYNVQYMAKLFDASAQSRYGKQYVLSGNNCHVVQEQVRYTLRLATVPELHYSTYINRMNCGYNPEKDFKPFWVI